MLRSLTQPLRNYQATQFRRETRSALSLLGYKLFHALAWPAYKAAYSRELKRTRMMIHQLSQQIKRTDKSAFVFANGPSMNDIDLQKVNALCSEGSHDLIAINSYLSNSAHLALPTYAVFADNLHFMSGQTQYAKDIAICETHQIPYFTPAKHCSPTYPLRYGFCGLVNIDARNTTDITCPLGYYGMTAFFALSLAKHLGYSRIYICGFDNSYFRDFEVRPDCSIVVKHTHYYDKTDRDTRVSSVHTTSTDFFFDTYRHFLYLEKITVAATSIFNIARTTYLSTVPRHLELDVYADSTRSRSAL